MIDALVSGRLVRDPQLRTGQKSGKPYVNFMLAVPVSEGEQVLVSGIAFGETAERIAKLGKGDGLSVSGSLKPSTWNDRASGELKYGLSVTVSAALSAYDIRRRRGGESKSTESAPQSRQEMYGGYSNYPEFNDDIAF